MNVHLKQHPRVFGSEPAPVDAAFAALFREPAVLSIGFAIKRLLDGESARIVVGIGPMGAR
ncbi:MAG: hypothetical protein DMG57_25000 [Acidobacteria bacterium]|nr:MAG: hypothetical protein DMG57_25000 [Acidobacteriota bacterium]